MSQGLNALVIGNAAYEVAGELKNPANDAEDYATKLETCGFSVIKEMHCSNAEMDRAPKRFNPGWSTLVVTGAEQSGIKRQEQLRAGFRI